MIISRREARELWFKIVFEYDFYPNPELDAQLDLFMEQQPMLTDEDRAEIKAKAKDIFTKIEELDKEISEKTEGWSVARMSRVDLSIIRLALYEIRYDDEVPVRVGINEAVELAKIYGGDESPKFVNGVLARLVKGQDE